MSSSTTRTAALFLLTLAFTWTAGGQLAVVETSSADCSTKNAPLARIEIEGTVDLAMDRTKVEPGALWVLFPNTGSNALGLPDHYKYAPHLPELVFDTNVWDYSIDSDISWTQSGTSIRVDLQEWHVSVLHPGGGKLVARREAISLPLPSSLDRCSLTWLFHLGDVTSKWPIPDFDASLVAPSLPNDKIFARIEVGAQVPADVFVGSYFSKDGSKACEGTQNTRVQALPHSVAVLVGLSAPPNQHLTLGFRDLKDQSAHLKQLTLTPKNAAAFEGRITLRSHPTYKGYADSILHYAMRKSPPKDLGYYVLPCQQFTGPKIPACCTTPPADNAQCSPAEHQYP